MANGGHFQFWHQHFNVGWIPRAFWEVKKRLSKDVCKSNFQTVWTDAATVVREVREEKVRRVKSQKRNSEKKDDQGARKGRKVVKRFVFPIFCGSSGS